MLKSKLFKTWLSIYLLIFLITVTYILNNSKHVTEMFILFMSWLVLGVIVWIWIKL